MKKKENIKIPKAINTNELFHHYANQVREGQTLGAYSYEGDILCHNTTKLARILDLKKKIVVIMDFDMRGSYGNGRSYYHVASAFSNEWTILKYDKLSNLYNIILTQNDYFKIALYHIKTELIHYVDVYGKEKELISNDNAFQEVHAYGRYLDNVKELIDMYVKKFKLSRKEILNYVYNERHFTTVRYKGWGTPVSERNDIDKPIKFYLDKTKWFTAAQQEVINFKQWKYKHFNKGGDTRGKTYLQIYNDLDLRVAFEDRVKIAIELNVLKRKQAAELYEAKTLRENFERLAGWLKGDSELNLWNIPVYMRIKNGCIETTRNARVPIEDGKRLFKLFNKIRNEVPPTRFTSKEEIKIGVYNFRNIELVGEYWYCNVGCHAIRDVEVDKFIYDNNLEEWLK